MRWKLGVLVALLGLSPVARADTPQPFFGSANAAAVLNAPSAVAQSVEQATNAVQPGVETLFDVHHSQWLFGTSAALYTFSSRSFPIASLRAGYAPAAAVYGEAQVDFAGITHRYVAPYVPAAVEGGVMSGVWSLLGKYGQVGAFAGYNFDQTATGSNHAGGIIVGVVVGGKLTF